MDIYTLLFYGFICGVLSLVAPKLGGWTPRFLIGALVGACSAATLPNLMALLG